MATTTTPDPTVQEGLYWGFSQAQIDVEKRRYVAAVQKNGKMRQSAGGGLPTFIAVNGRQVTYSFPEGISSFEQWRHELQNAEDQLAGNCQRYTDRAAARF